MKIARTVWGGGKLRKESTYRHPYSESSAIIGKILTSMKGKREIGDVDREWDY